MGVLFNQGDGTFCTAALYDAVTVPQAVLASDLNGDSKPDLVVASQTDPWVGVLLNATAP